MPTTSDALTAHQMIAREQRKLIRAGMSRGEALHAALRTIWPPKGDVPVSSVATTTTTPALRQDTAPVAVSMTPDQVDLLKRTIAKGATDDELRLFLHIANRTGLDPFAKQLHAVKRWDKTLGREVMSVQTGIDGYRLIAERTGKYAPGDEPSFVEDDKGRVVKATAYVKKLTADGTWHKVAASAHYAEYAQTTRDGTPTRFWKQMPHVMLAKVESESKAKPATLTGEQIQALRERATEAKHKRDDVLRWLKVGKLTEVKQADFEAIMQRLGDPAPLNQPITPEVVEREPGDETEQPAQVAATDEPADSQAIEL